MHESNRILELVKQAAAEAVAASRPFALTYGMVDSLNPLTVTVDQKLTLEAAQLLLTSAVRDYTAVMSTERTDDDGKPYDECSDMTVHNALQEGEKVLLLRVQGGKQYIILDRVEALT